MFSCETLVLLSLHTSTPEPKIQQQLVQVASKHPPLVLMATHSPSSLWIDASTLCTSNPANFPQVLTAAPTALCNWASCFNYEILHSYCNAVIAPLCPASGRHPFLVRAGSAFPAFLETTNLVLTLVQKQLSGKNLFCKSLQFTKVYFSSIGLQK